MGAGGSFEYVAKFVEEDPDLDDDEQRKLAAYVREHRITGKRAKKRFGNDKAALDAIAGPKAGAVCRGRLRQKKVQVGKKAEEFFENVKDFISAKHEIDATASQVLPRSYMDSYQSFKPAVLRHGEGMSIDDVYQSAELTRGAFERVARGVVEAAGLDPDQVVTHDGEELMLTDELPFTRLCLAPPKGHARAAEKIRDDYEGDASRLVDVNRCSIVVDEEQQLVAVASKLMEGSLCEVVRLKNRFAEPLFNGYRDALYSVRVSSGDVSHVCELQLHLAAVIAHKEKTHHYYEYFRSYFAGSMAEVDSRMKDLMDIGISHDKSLEGLVNDLAASCTDVPRLKGLARFLGYGGMDEYELAARLYDRCLDVHLTSLTTARTLWRDKTASIAQSFRGIDDANALKHDSKPVEEICRAQLEAADNLQWHGSEGHERPRPTCCAPEIIEAWEAQCEAWRKAGALFRETRDRASSKLGNEHPVTLKAAASLAGWILEDKDGDWTEAFDLCSDVRPRVEIEFRAPIDATSSARWRGGRTLPHWLISAQALPKLAKVLGATHPDTLDARSQLAQICWSATTKASRGRVEAAGYESSAHAAAALFAENIQAYRDMGEPDSEHRLMNMTQLARVYNEPALARYDDSLAVLREALERYRRTLGEANSNTDACLELLMAQKEGLQCVADGEPWPVDDDDDDEAPEEDEDEDDGEEDDEDEDE